MNTSFGNSFFKARPAVSGAAQDSGWLRWLANYGLSLSGADYTVPEPYERESACPFAVLVKPQQKHS